MGTCHIVWALVTRGYICSNFGIFAIFPAARVLQVLKMVFLCFGPEAVVIEGLKLWVASMQKPKVHLPSESEVQPLE